VKLKREIRDFGKRLAEEFKPERIVLFGSHSRGEANADSDVDLLVIMPTQRDPIDVQVEMRLKLRPSFPLDLLVRTPSKIKERLAIGDPFLQSILDNGEVLYEAPNG